MLIDWKVGSNFQPFDWWTAFQPSKFLKLKINQLNFWTDRKIVINFHMNGNYPLKKINWKKYEYFKKSNFIQVQKPFNSWIILALGYLGALGQFGETGPKYPNGLGYTESTAKSSIPHLAPNDVIRLISIQAFQVIDWIFAISFSIWACTFMKK